MFAGKKSAQIREILISESAWEEMTCLFAPSLEEGQDIDSQVLLTEMGIAEANNVSRRQCVVTSIQPIQKLEA